MFRKYLKISILVLVACEFAVLIPGVFERFRYNDDVNTHYFWLNFARGDYFFADELRRFQTIGWRLLGDFVRHVPINLVLLSKVYTLLLYAGFLFFSFRFAKRISSKLPLFPYVFLLLLSIHPSIFKDISGGLPRSWAPLLQVLALNFALQFDWKQIATVILSALFHPMSFLINVLVILQGYLVKIRENVKAPLLFLLLVFILTGILWLDQRHISKLDGNVLTQRNFEAFKPGYRNDYDQIRPLQVSFMRKFVENSELEYNYVVFLKRFDLSKDDDTRKAARKFARVRKYFILALCLAGIFLAVRFSLLPRELIFWTVACLILYFAAILFAWRLYAPDRYIFPLAIFLPSWFLAVLFGKALEKFPTYGAALLIVYVLAWGTGLHPDFYYKDFTPWKRLVLYINGNVPKDATICGHPRDMDPIPLLTGRRACICREFIQPWRPKLYERNMKLADEAISYVFLTGDQVSKLRGKDIDYLLIGKQWFAEDYLEGESRVFDKPTGDKWEFILRSENRSNLIFHPENKRLIHPAVLYEDERFMLVSVPRLLSVF